MCKINYIHRVKLLGLASTYIQLASSTSPAIVARLQISLREAEAKMWKFFAKKFRSSSGASVTHTPSGSLADLRGKFYLDKVS